MLAENCGQDGTTVVSQLYAAHQVESSRPISVGWLTWRQAGEKNAGVDITNASVGDMVT